MPEPSTARLADIEFAVVQDVDDFAGLFDCSARAFGDQINDGVWTGLHPSWHTPEGRAAHAARMTKRWQSVTKDQHGRPNTIFLKATVPVPAAGGEGQPSSSSSNSNSNQRTIVGVAIWSQLSFVAGHGDEPSNKLVLPKDDAPGAAAVNFASEEDARFATQLWAGLMLKRVEVLRAKAATDSPAAFTLDLCAVDPAFQRRGIAAKLVQWGLDEAARRGGLEATTEASVMGRHVYRKLGFNPVGEIDYGVDEALMKGRKLPSNLFMRTGPVV